MSASRWVPEAMGNPTGFIEFPRRDRAYAPVESAGVAPELVELAYDPQTAGGLLVSLPADKGPVLEAEFARAGVFLARIGSVHAGSGLELTA